MAKKETTVTTANLKDDILELATKIREGVSIDKKSGVGAAEADLYEKNLPDGLTTDVVKQVKEFDAAFVAAGTYAFGQLAVEAMTKNKDLSQATIEFKMGHHDTMGVTVDRSKEFTNPLSTDGAKVKRFGATTVSFDARAGHIKSGQLKQARLAITELAAAQLKA